jgi:hypothetical protein
MNRAGLCSTVVAVFFLGSILPTYGQQDRHDQGNQGKPGQGQPAQPQGQRQPPAQASKAAQPQAAHSPARPQPAIKAPAPQPAKPATSAPARSQPAYGGAYHGGVKPTAPTNGGVHPSGVPQAPAQVRSGFQQSRATSWTTQHQTWQQRGGYNGYRIPESRFSQYFGSGHFFHIGGLPLLFVGGYPRFQYDGYWVTVMDPWPDNWAPDWYETDNLYVDWVGDGYYLFDSNYPGIGLAVTISF